jgi:hypothetical protein
VIKKIPENTVQKEMGKDYCVCNKRAKHGAGKHTR